MANGVDYAFNPHPSTSALKANGKVFACRYISSYGPNDKNGKNLLAAEKSNLLGAGISVVVVAEESANRMLGGAKAGTADAQHADAVVKALGMTGIPIYFACDWDSSVNDQVAINLYLDACAKVIGKARTGIYGGYYPVKRAFDSGKVAYGWQTYAWSGGQWDSRAQLRQVKNGVTIGGASCDLDTSMKTDYGQWPRPKAFAPAKPANVAKPGAYPAPKGLSAASVALAVKWAPVVVAGKAVASYTIQAVGMNNHVYVSMTSPTNSAVLSGLTHGWTYEVRVWANGGPVSPPHASLKVTV